MRLECWSYDGKIFTGYVYGSEYFEDGTAITTGANYVDWPAKKILIGKQEVALGGSREELNSPEEDELPW